MTLYELCLEYLDFLNLIASGHYLSPLESLLDDGIGIREEIAENLECDVDRLIMVTDNLDIAIDFKPPTKRYESTRVYAKDLERLLTCAAGRMFLRGKAYRLTTAYGIIQEPVS